MGYDPAEIPTDQDGLLALVKSITGFEVRMHIPEYEGDILSSWVEYHDPVAGSWRLISPLGNIYYDLVLYPVNPITREPLNGRRYNKDAQEY